MFDTLIMMADPLGVSSKPIDTIIVRLRPQERPLPFNNHNNSEWVNHRDLTQIRAKLGNCKCWEIY